MAKKRFTDVEIWDKEWFMELSPKHKCFIRYLFDKCDSSGMWKPNWKLASLQIGEPVSMKDLNAIPTDQYEILDGKIFLPDFINFQYGRLSEASPAHKPIFKEIERNNLSNRVFNRVSNTLQEKETDKEKDKEEETEMDKDFGKSENILDETALLPKMAKIFKRENPNYTDHQEFDFPALKKIAEFICKQTGTSFQPRDGDVQKIVLDSWLIVSQWVATHKHYSNLNLSQIHKYIQSISTEIKNEQSGSKVRKQGSGTVKGTRSEVQQVFNDRYSQE